MRAIFKPLTEAANRPRWQLFFKPISGVWVTRELPRLDDGNVMQFVCDFARRQRMPCALALQDRWTLWISDTGNITSIESRTPGGRNRQYMTSDHSAQPSVWISDLGPEDDW